MDANKYRRETGEKKIEESSRSFCPLSNFECKLCVNFQRNIQRLNWMRQRSTANQNVINNDSREHTLSQTYKQVNQRSKQTNSMEVRIKCTDIVLRKSIKVYLYLEM